MGVCIRKKCNYHQKQFSHVRWTVTKKMSMKKYDVDLERGLVKKPGIISLTKSYGTDIVGNKMTEMSSMTKPESMNAEHSYWLPYI